MNLTTITEQGGVVFDANMDPRAVRVVKHSIQVSPTAGSVRHFKLDKKGEKELAALPERRQREFNLED